MAERPAFASSITPPRAAWSVKWNPVIRRSGEVAEPLMALLMSSSSPPFPLARRLSGRLEWGRFQART